jgi:hypothetical protein
VRTRVLSGRTSKQMLKYLWAGGGEKGNVRLEPTLTHSLSMSFFSASTSAICWASLSFSGLRDCSEEDERGSSLVVARRACARG